MNMDVILPQNTSGQIGMEGHADQKLKTLYLLHGKSDDHTIWQRRTSIERYATEYGIAVVMPAVHLSFYSNLPNGMRYWDYVSEELPGICRTFFPQLSAKREDNFAAGLSMGGYGALKFGLLKNEQFGAVASLSGALDIALSVEDPAFANSKLFYQSVFGDMERFAGSPNDLMAAAQKLHDTGGVKPKIYIWCGKQDFLYAQNISAKNKLRALQFDVTYEESDGDHQWKYWDDKIRRVLEWLPL